MVKHFLPLRSNSTAQAARDDTGERPGGRVDKDGAPQEEDPPEHAGIRDRIAHFTWPWFAVTMSTGAVATIISSTPNTFDGLQTIGKIFFIADLVLFALFTLVMAARAMLFPRRFVASLHHPTEGLFFGAYFVSISLIIDCTQSYGVPNCGPWLVDALRVLYWIYCAVTLIVAVVQYYVFFHEERLNTGDAMPVWIFPIYPLLVVGPMAGLLIPSQPRQQGLDMWVGAVMLQGLAWMVALMMYVLYTQRLMMSPLPPPPARPGMFISVGPAGYTAAGLVSLGRTGQMVLPANFFGTTTVSAGDVVRIVGAVSGTFVILFAFWFFCVSSIAVISGLRQMKFTLSWWAFVFPNAGLTLAAIQISNAYSSPGIKGVCSALTIMLVILWLNNATFHIIAVIKGQILWPGKDEDKTIRGLRWGKYSA